MAETVKEFANMGPMMLENLLGSKRSGSGGLQRAH